MDKILLLGFFLSSFVVPFLSEAGKILARRLFSEKQKSLPEPSDNAMAVIFKFYK